MIQVISIGLYPLSMKDYMGKDNQSQVYFLIIKCNTMCMYEIDFNRPGKELFAIETDRLRLAVLRKNSAQAVTDYLVRNKEFHQKWSQTHNDSYFLLKTQKKYLSYDETEYKAGRLVPLWIMKKDEPDRIIGRVSFFNIAYGGMMSCAVGYHLDEGCTGKGYMREALLAASCLMAKELKMHRIEAFILPENERSLNLIRKAGFTEEGLRKSYMHINGQWRDHMSFYILDETLRKIF